MENIDILIKIQEINEWSEMGALLDLSKKVRRGILRREILSKCFNFYLEKKEKFPAWCLTSIPLSEDLAEVIPQLKDLSHIVSLEIQKYNVPHKEFFVTGGFVAACVYDTEYSDIDIWYKRGEEDSVREKIGDIDYVPAPLTFLNEAISGFDISSCQIGVLFKEGLQPVTYFTPFFLYNLYFSKIISRFMPLEISYFIPSSPYDYNMKGRETKCSISMKDLHDLHIKHNTGPDNLLKNAKWYEEEEYVEYCEEHGIKYIEDPGKRVFTNFYDCLQCLGLLKARHQYGKGQIQFLKYTEDGQNYPLMVRWMQRLKKYGKRFKDCQMIFVESENLYRNPYD